MSTPAETEDPPAARELVLIVEDEPGIVDFVSRGLTAEGFEVVSAGDGRAGILAAENQAVDIVVLDVLLPEVDGIAVLERLRTTRPDLPVIVLTALGEVDDRIRGLEAGAVDYLAKPFALRELIARIRAQLRAGAARPPSRSCAVVRSRWTSSAAA